MKKSLSTAFLFACLTASAIALTSSDALLAAASSGLPANLKKALTGHPEYRGVMLAHDTPLLDEALYRVLVSQKPGAEPEMLQTLVAAGANPSGHNTNQVPLLTNAIALVDVPAVDFLLDRGADPNGHDQIGSCAADSLVRVAEHGQADASTVVHIAQSMHAHGLKLDPLTLGYAVHTNKDNPNPSLSALVLYLRSLQ